MTRRTRGGQGLNRSGEEDIVKALIPELPGPAFRAWCQSQPSRVPRLPILFAIKLAPLWTLDGLQVKLNLGYTNLYAPSITPCGGPAPCSDREQGNPSKSWIPAYAGMT